MALGVREKTTPLAMGIDEPTRLALEMPEEIEIAQAIRMAGVEFTAEGHLSVIVDYHAQTEGGGVGKLLSRKTFTFTGQAQPPDPPADVTDPETGEVLIAAGSRFVGLPDLATLRAMLIGNSNVGEVLDSFRQNLYTIGKQLNQHWTSATKI